jgi:hypothetical protein
MSNPPIIHAVSETSDAWGRQLLSKIGQPVEVKSRRQGNATREQKLEATLQELEEFKQRSLEVQVSNNSMAAALQAAGLI